MNLSIPQKLMATGKLAEAQKTLPPTGTVSDPRYDLLSARIHMESGDNDLAISVLEDLQKRFPKYAPARLFLGIAFWDASNYDDAGKAFNATLELQPSNDLARSYFALVFIAQGDSATAGSLWKKYGFSDNAMFRVRTAEYVEAQWLESGRYMEDCSKPGNESPRKKVSERKALSLFYKRDFRGMLAHVPESPTDKELSAFLGATAHEMLSEYGAARQYLEALKIRREEWPDPLIALNARLLTREGRLTEAAEEFSKILILGPEDFGSNYYLGIICLAYGKNMEARQYFLRSLTNYMVDTREFQWWQIEQVLAP